MHIFLCMVAHFFVQMKVRYCCNREQNPAMYLVKRSVLSRQVGRLSESGHFFHLPIEGYKLY